MPSSNQPTQNEFNVIFGSSLPHNALSGPFIYLFTGSLHIHYDFQLCAFMGFLCE